MEINEHEERTLQYTGVCREVVTQARCKNPDRITMDNSLDNGYTISVKSEDEKQDLLTEETLQVVEPRHWTVDYRGVLVNADESEVVVKVEKPDWTTETEMF